MAKNTNAIMTPQIASLCIGTLRNLLLPQFCSYGMCEWWLAGAGGRVQIEMC